MSRRRYVEYMDECKAQAMKQALPALEKALSCLLEEHALHGEVRLIQAGDEHCLTSAEAQQFASFALRRRRCSGAVRDAARRLCARLGLGHREFLRDGDGLPVWPADWLGSFSHDDAVAVVVLGRRSPLQGVGIDVEAPDPLEAELVDRVVADSERAAFAHARLDGKAVFSIKEAIFKAAYPTDRLFLEFDQVTLDFAARTALTAYGRTLHWRVVTGPRVLALAWY